MPRNIIIILFFLTLTNLVFFYRDFYYKMWCLILKFLLLAMEIFHNFHVNKNIILKCLYFFYWSWRLQSLGIGTTCGSLSAVKAWYFLQASFKICSKKNIWNQKLSVKKMGDWSPLNSSQGGAHMCLCWLNSIIDYIR